MLIKGSLVFGRGEVDSTSYGNQFDSFSNDSLKLHYNRPECLLRRHVPCWIIKIYVILHCIKHLLCLFFLVKCAFQVYTSIFLLLLTDTNIMMTSSNGNIFLVTGHLCGEFADQRPVTRNFDIFFDLHPNKLLSKQLWGWWFETPSCPSWRHRNDK